MKLIHTLFIATVVACVTPIYAIAGKADQQRSVKFSQTLDPDTKVDTTDRPQRQKSRVFFRRVKGRDLNKGVNFTLDADSGIVQLTPLDGIKNGRKFTRTSLPRGLTLSNGKERRSVEDDSIALRRSTQSLRSASPEFFGRAHAMRVPSEMGRGRFALEANGNASEDDEYVLYVLDKNSDISLNVTAPKVRIARRSALNFSAFVDSNGKTTVESLSAELVSPAGNRYPIKGKMKNGRFESNWPANVSESHAPGELWEIQVHAMVRNAANELVERIAVVATDIFEQTATLDDVDTESFGLELSVNVSQEGRYEARALVFGRDDDGKYKPALLSYQAEYLPAGTGKMRVEIDSDQMLGSGLMAPFEVRHVKLIDQQNLSVIATKDGKWSLQRQ